MRTEVEKKAHGEEIKRRYQEKVRMKEKVWTYVEVCRLVSKWCGGTMNDKYLEYTTLWKWLDIRAKKETKNIQEMSVTEGGVKLSLEYLRRVHDDEMMEHTARTLREKCEVKMDDFLVWSESELAAFVYRSEQLIETDRMEKQTHVVRKNLIEAIKAGDKKAMSMWLEMTGRDKADLKDKEGFTMQVVDKYDVHSQEFIPGDTKVVNIDFKRQISESLGTGQQETSTNLQ